MIPIPIPELARQARPLTAPILMGPPAGLSDDDCGTVQMLVTQEVLPRIGRAHYAYFRPTPEELDALNTGAYLELALYGAGVQPFSLLVQGMVPTDIIDHSSHARRAVAPDGMWMRIARERIATERARQLTEEGYTEEHDRKHPSTELLGAARAYADVGRHPEQDWTTPHTAWPWESHEWKPLGPIPDLTRAGALYVAELDLKRLNGVFLEQVNSEFDQLVTDLATALSEQW